MLTRSGIAYDLNISPHIHEIDYKDNKIKYIFSSNLYKEKFIEKLEENRKQISEGLSKRYGFKIMNHIISDLKLYSKIEKRGFLIEANEERYECLNIIVLDGLNQIVKN